jgi:hypothetical protein
VAASFLESNNGVSWAHGFFTRVVDNPIMRAAILILCLSLIVDAYWFDSKYMRGFVQMTTTMSRTISGR